MKRLLIIIVWLPATLITIWGSIVFFSYRTDFLLKQRLVIENIKENGGSEIFAALPKVLGLSVASAKANDPAVETIRQYYKKYKSPMKGTEEALVNICREHDIDPFLIVAVAQCETNLGKKSPEDCNNPFGLGIYGKKKLCFDDWEQSYNTMVRTLKKNYFDRGLDTPELIMTKYCPASIENSDGHWGKCVDRFMKEIESNNL